MDVFPAKHDLLALFETEPSLADAGVPWAYNALRFETQRGTNDRVICEIEPGYERLEIRWSRDGVDLIHLDLHWVNQLLVENEGGREALVARFRDDHLLPLRLQLRPSIHIRWGTDPEPPRRSTD
jgi:hypothetical protein